MNFSDLIIDWTDTPKGDMTTSFTYSNSIYDVVVKHQTSNKKHKKYQPLKYCPKCHASLDKCDTHTTKGHEQHRFCKTCHWSNF